MLPTAGSDMLYTVQPVDILRKAKVIVAPAKATAADEVMHYLTALRNTLMHCLTALTNPLMHCLAALTNPFTCRGVR